MCEGGRAGDPAIPQGLQLTASTRWKRAEPFSGPPSFPLHMAGQSKKRAVTEASHPQRDKVLDREWTVGFLAPLGLGEVAQAGGM